MDGLHDHKFNIRLVKTVKKYPALYNTDLVDYTKREARERAWIDVGIELNCDPKALQRKWQNFRTILVRKLKQKQMGEPVNKQYYLYPYIKFVIPFLKKSYDPEAIKRTPKNDVSTEDEEEAENQYETGSDQSMEENNGIQETDGMPDPIYYDEDDDTMQIIAHKTIKRSNSFEEDGIVIEDEENCKQQQNETNLHNTFANKSINLTPSYNLSSPADYSKHKHFDVDDNAKKQFLLSLLPDLEEMTNSQMRKFKSKVLFLVEDILKDNAT